MATASYKTIRTFISDGSQTSFNFALDYLRKPFIGYKVDGVTKIYNTDYTISGQELIPTTIPPKGATVVIQRITPTERLVVWKDASVLRSSDLTSIEVQILHLTEEEVDRAITQENNTQEQVDRSIKIPKGISASVELPIPTPLHSFRWNITGDDLETTLDPATVVVAAEIEKLGAQAAKQEAEAALYEAQVAKQGSEAARDSAEQSAIQAGISASTADATILRADLEDATTGATLIGFKQSFAGAFDRTLRIKVKENISLRDFGAIGDGQSHPLSELFLSLTDAQIYYPFVTDLTDEIDWAAAQQAVNVVSAAGGGELKTTKGSFVFNRDCIVSSYIYLLGDGEFGSVFKPRAGYAGSGFSLFKITGSAANSIKFKSFLIDGDGANHTAIIHGIEFNSSSSPIIYCKIIDMTVKECRGYNLKVVNADQLLIDHSIIRDAYQGNVYVSNADYFKMVGGSIRSAKGTANGIVLDGNQVNRASLFGVTCSSNGGFALFATQCNKVDTEGCTFDNNQSAVFYDRVVRGKIKGCTAETNTEKGFHVKGQSGLITGIQVEANTAYLNGRDGILLENANGNKISGNTVEENNTSNNADANGIHLIGSTGSSDNTITDTRARFSATGKQRWGVKIANVACVGNKVTGNDLRGGGYSGDFDNVGTGTITV